MVLFPQKNTAKYLFTLLFLYNNAILQLNAETVNDNYRSQVFKTITVSSSKNAEKNGDHTELLQDAFSSGASMVIIPDKGTPWITRPLFLESSQIIFLYPGTVIEAKKGEFLGRGDKIFEAENKTDISIYGYGAVIRMNKNDYREAPYTIGQWRHGISFRSCRNITVAGLTIENTGGDGVYIGALSEPVTYSENIVLKDLKLINNYRQGISIISAKNLIIDGCEISGTQGHAPMAGIDFEPNHSHEILQNITIKNCTIKNNMGAGVLLYLASLNEESEPVSINIISNNVSGSFYALRIAKTGRGQSGVIYLRDNRFSLFKRIDPSRKLKVIFD